MNSFGDYKDYNKKRFEKLFFNQAKEVEKTAGTDPGAHLEILRLGFKVLELNKYNQDAIIMINKSCKVINDDMQVQAQKDAAKLEINDCLC